MSNTYANLCYLQVVLFLLSRSTETGDRADLCLNSHARTEINPPECPSLEGQQPTGAAVKTLNA